MSVNGEFLGPDPSLRTINFAVIRDSGDPLIASAAVRRAPPLRRALLSLVILGCSSGGGTAGSGGTTAGTGAHPGSGGTNDGGSGGTGGAPVGGTGGSTTSGGGVGAPGTGGGGQGAGSGANGGAGGAATGGVAGLWVCPAGPFTGNPVPVGAAPSRVPDVPPADSFNHSGTDFSTVEGPVWTGGALYLSEMVTVTTGYQPARILKFEPNAAVPVSVQLPDSGSNGMAVNAAGDLVTANHKVGGIVKFTLPGGTATNLVTTYGGVRFDSPNDLTLSTDGAIYFTDPSHQAVAPFPQAQTRVYRVAPGSSTATVITNYTNQPNGITLSLDEKTLFVGGGNGVLRYPVAANGTVGAGTQVFAAASDGMGIDCAGHLYVAVIGHNYVVVLDTSGGGLGTEIGRLTAPGAGSATNVAFGGDDHRTVFITTLGAGTQKGLFQVQVNIPGMPY